MIENLFIHLPEKILIPKRMFEKQLMGAKREALETRDLTLQTDTGYYNYKLENITKEQIGENYSLAKKLKYKLLYIPKKLIKTTGLQLAILEYDTQEERTAAEKGDVDAQYRLANVYMDGLLVDKNYDEALKWYSLASDSGHAGAKLRIAMMYGHGLGVAKDKDNAIKWAEKAATLGNLQAQIILSYTYSSEAPYINQKKAFKWCAKAAERGYADAQNNLALEYEKKKKYKKALEWLNKSAERGNVFARYNLGIYYEEGFNVKKDINKAKDWYKLAAEMGHLESQYQLGKIYCYNKRNYTSAERWFKRTAKRDYMDSQYMLGLIKHKQKQFEKSKKHLKKEKWMSIRAEYMLGQYNIVWSIDNLESKNNFFNLFKYIAEEGDFSAQHAMGQIYERGFGVKQDYKKAIKWYEKSAEQDYDTAQYSLAVLYENGLGVKKDISKASKLYKRAGQQRNIAARMISEGIYEGKFKDWKYLKHLLSDKDSQHVFANALFKELIRKRKMIRWKIRSIKWYWEQASFKENQYAQYNLGRLYMLGIKMEKDYINAYKWLFLSKRNGVRKAGYKLKYLKTLMSKEEIKEAKESINRYLGKTPQST